MENGVFMAKTALFDTMQRFSGERCICRISVVFCLERCVEGVFSPQPFRMAMNSSPVMVSCS